MYNGTAIVLQVEYIQIYHDVLSPLMGKHIGYKMSMLFFLQRRRLRLFTKGCFFKGFQKRWEGDKGKAEFVISVLVPAVPDNIKLPHVVLDNLTSYISCAANAGSDVCWMWWCFAHGLVQVAITHLSEKGRCSPPSGLRG